MVWWAVWFGGLVDLWSGGLVAWWPGGLLVWWPGGVVVWWPGGLVALWSGGPGGIILAGWLTTEGTFAGRPAEVFSDFKLSTKEFFG